MAPQVGAASPSQRLADEPPTRANLRIAILGTGFAGLGMAIALQQAGFRQFTLYEQADRLGGTWRDNHYPGAACDVPSRLYSFSFALNPDWSRLFSGHGEILGYLERCARDYGLLPRIRFSCGVEAARWDDSRSEWTLNLSDGTTATVDVVISGLGQLNRPAIPNLPGLADFAGPHFHSARWRHDVPLAGQRVAVVGTGASAVQFIPPVARQARQLTVFQRTPNWIIGRNDRPHYAWERALYRALPPLDRLMRWAIYLFMEQRFWLFKRGSRRSDQFTLKALRHLIRQVPDPRLRKALTPDYAIGCKRILLSDDFYPTFARDNVALETSGIARVVPDGLETTDGRHIGADVLIFATGFETLDMLQPVALFGIDGAALHEQWRAGVEAYLGISVANFPNLFLLYGPNTNLGHNSIIFMLEAQIRYIVEGLQLMLSRGASQLSVRLDSQSSYNAEIQKDLKGTAFAADCASWYKTGDGRVVNNWPHSSVRYWWRLRHFDAAAYRFGKRQSDVGQSDNGQSGTGRN